MGFGDLGLCFVLLAGWLASPADLVETPSRLRASTYKGPSNSKKQAFWAGIIGKDPVRCLKFLI